MRINIGELMGEYLGGAKALWIAAGVFGSWLIDMMAIVNGFDKMATPMQAVVILASLVVLDTIAGIAHALKKREPLSWTKMQRVVERVYVYLMILVMIGVLGKLVGAPNQQIAEGVGYVAKGLCVMPATSILDNLAKMEVVGVAWVINRLKEKLGQQFGEEPKEKA